MRITITEAFDRLASAGCRVYALNPYIHDERPEHGDSCAYGGYDPITGHNDELTMIELVSFSDYGGSDIDHANYRTLINDHGEGCFVHLTGGHGTTGLALPYGVALPGDDEDNGILALIVHAIDYAADCGVMDDEEHSELISELADETWDQWLSFDVHRELDRMCDGNADDLGFTDEEIREVYYGHPEIEWLAESATDVVNANHEETMRYLVKEMALAWLLTLNDPAQTVLV